MEKVSLSTSIHPFSSLSPRGSVLAALPSTPRIDPGFEGERPTVAGLSALPNELLRRLPVHDARPLRLVNQRFGKVFAGQATVDGLTDKRPVLASVKGVERMLNRLKRDVHEESLMTKAFTQLTRCAVGQLMKNDQLVVFKLIATALRCVPRPLEALARLAAKASRPLRAHQQRELLEILEAHPAWQSAEPYSQVVALERYEAPLVALSKLRSGLVLLSAAEKQDVLESFIEVMSITTLNKEDCVKIGEFHADLPWPPRAASILLAHIGWLPAPQLEALQRCAGIVP